MYKRKYYLISKFKPLMIVMSNVAAALIGLLGTLTTSCHVSQD